MPLNNEWPNIAPMSRDQLNELVEILSTMFELTIKGNTAVSVVSPFNSEWVASVTIKEYISRFVQFTGLTEEHLIVAKILLDRYTTFNPQYSLTDLNILRLLAATYYLTHKLCEEQGDVLPLSYFATIAGISTRETKLLEIELLARLDYQLSIPAVMYLMYKKNIIDFARFKTYRDDGSFYSLSMHPEELSMFEQLLIDPLYQSPANANVSIDLELLADEAVSSPPFYLPPSAMPAAATSAIHQLLPTLSSPPNLNRTSSAFFQLDSLDSRSLGLASPTSEVLLPTVSDTLSRPLLSDAIQEAHDITSWSNEYAAPISLGVGVPNGAVKHLARKVPSKNTSESEIQSPDDDNSYSQETMKQRKKQKTTGHAYDPRFLATSSASSITNGLSNQASTPNIGS